MESKSIRPTKKQRELLAFIEQFIAERGYSPSYREIMAGCGYASVATVALHVNNLIKRGHLAKRDHSARSLEIVVRGPSSHNSHNFGAAQSFRSEDSKWLFSEVDRRFKDVEAGDKTRLDELYVLVGAVNVLGFSEVGRAYAARLKDL